MGTEVYFILDFRTGEFCQGEGLFGILSFRHRVVKTYRVYTGMKITRADI